MVRAGLLPLLAVLVAVEVHAAPVERLPLSDVRAIEARIAAQDVELDRRLETFRDQRQAVAAQAAALAARWRHRCASGRADGECARLRAAHEQLQDDDTLLLADAWRVEADHLWAIDRELGDVADRSFRERGGTESGRRQASAAERQLLGQEAVTREVAAHFGAIQSLRAEIAARVSEAERHLGADRGRRMGLILAARASKARALAQALEEGAQALEDAVAVRRLANQVALGEGLREAPIAALPAPRARPVQPARAVRHALPVYAMSSPEPAYEAWSVSSHEVGWHEPGMAIDMGGLFAEVDRLHAEAARLHARADRWHARARRSFRGGW